MTRRLLAWALVTPVAAAGILAAHALAYALTGTATGSLHDYLGHGPQVVGVLASLGLVGLALQERSVGRPPALAFALLAPLGFACQEHVERLVHTGELPWLLTTPAFLLGLALQAPVALLCVFVARRVTGIARPACAARDPLRSPRCGFRCRRPRSGARESFGSSARRDGRRRLSSRPEPTAARSRGTHEERADENDCAGGAAASILAVAGCGGDESSPEAATTDQITTVETPPTTTQETTPATTTPTTTTPASRSRRRS